MYGFVGSKLPNGLKAVLGNGAVVASKDGSTRYAELDEDEVPEDNVDDEEEDGDFWFAFIVNGWLSLVGEIGL